MKKILFVLFLFLSFSLQSASISSIRSHVLDAPKIKKHDKLDSVVDYLSRQYRDDEDKALAILTWIVLNIDYDEYYYQKADENNRSRRDLSRYIPKQGDIIETRLGVCKDIAALYSEMLQMADIESRVISGCVTQRNSQRACRENPHAWNAVWINKQWELVDPTYAMGEAGAMGEISTKRRYERAVKKRSRRTSGVFNPRTDRRIDTMWFMTDPKVMEKDHHPDDERWYLIKRSDRKRKD